MYTEYNRNISTGNTCSKSTDTVYQPATNIRADGLTDTADGTDFNMHTAANDMSGSRNMMPMPAGTTTGRASVANSQVPQKFYARDRHKSRFFTCISQQIHRQMDQSGFPHRQRYRTARRYSTRCRCKLYYHAGYRACNIGSLRPVCAQICNNHNG